MTGRIPDPTAEIWFRPNWHREGRVGDWHLLAAGEVLPGGRAVCGYTQWYKETGYETIARDRLFDQTRVRALLECARQSFDH